MTHLDAQGVGGFRRLGLDARRLIDLLDGLSEICCEEAFSSSALVDSSSAVAASSSADFCALVEVFKASAISARSGRRRSSPSRLWDLLLGRFSGLPGRPRWDSSAAAATSSAPFRNTLALDSRIRCVPLDFGTIGLNLAEIGRDFEQILGDGFWPFPLPRALLAGRFGVRGYYLHLVLDLVYDFLNTAGALLADFRQVAHFIGDHGESLPCSPARAASIAALRASKLVWSAIRVTAWTNLAILLALALQFADHFGGFQIGLGGVADSLAQASISDVVELESDCSSFTLFRDASARPLRCREPSRSG